MITRLRAENLMVCCSKCGARIPKGNFCLVCGSPLLGVLPPVFKKKEAYANNLDKYMGAVSGAIGGFILGVATERAIFYIPGVDIIWGAFLSFLGLGVGFALGRYMLWLNPVTLPFVILYKIFTWYYSPEQEIERTKRSLRKCEEKIERKVLLSILDEGRMLNDEELVAEKLELSRLAEKSRALVLQITDDVQVPIKSAVDQIQRKYLEYIHTNGNIDVPNAARELGITELQLVNILNYSLKSGLINGHFTSDGKGFKTKEYVALRLKEKLA